MAIRIIFVVCLLTCRGWAADLAVTDRELPRVSATEPRQAVATLQVREGFRVELLASEPLVVDPVALAFDENGRMFVAEMRDYSERRDEHLGGHGQRQRQRRQRQRPLDEYRVTVQGGEIMISKKV